jgi:DNA adenine methylase
MTYQGSKEKIAMPIVEILCNLRKPDQLYWEPFLGSASTFVRMHGPKLGTDAMTDLILLWNQVIRDEFIEPSFVTKETYTQYMKDKTPSALRAYIGFFWSFSGMFNKGYSPEYFQGSRSFYSMQQRAKKLAGKDTILMACDYREPDISNALIYCDPPYAGTTPYKGAPNFDTPAFIQWCQNQTLKNNTVVVSEYFLPNPPFQLIESFEFRTSLATNKRDQSKPENLYILS